MSSEELVSSRSSDDAGLESLPTERLVALLREKRSDEAKVRARLREVEGERDTQAQRVKALAGTQMSQLALENRVLPNAVAHLHEFMDVDSLFNAEGVIDTESFKATLDGLRQERGYLFVQSAPASTPTGVPSGDSHPSQHQRQAQWGDVL